MGAKLENVFLEAALTGRMTTEPFFSYMVGGERKKSIVPDKEWNLLEYRREGIREFEYETTPCEGLALRVEAKIYEGFQAFEWVMHFRNTGTTRTPILSDVLPLDLDFEIDTNAPLQWRSIKGDICGEESFLPVEHAIEPEAEYRVAAQGGRSSCANFPFFNLCHNEGGVICAIGWTGQWAASVKRRNGKAVLQAGMERTRLYLKPGETIRSPRILVMPWRGESLAAHNRFRRLMMEHFSPKKVMEPGVFLPATLQNFDRYIGLPEWRTESGQLRSIDLASKCEHFDTYWLDAGWFKDYFPNGVGNYTYAEGFPNGLKPVADEAHRRGLNFVLWFEPERVVEGTELYEQHRDWLLDVAGRTQENNPEKSEYLFYILNIGNPEARTWVIETVSRFIQEVGIDVYRQDFNIDPLQFWREHDEPDREGFTEIKYIEGLYAIWDALLERFPHLLIDNCASGGRRLDIETCARSVPLWRSDTGCIPTRKGWESDVWNHNQVLGLSTYLPYHSTASWSPKAYDFRSAATMGIAGNFDVFADDFSFEEAQAALAEYKRLRKYWKGDFYPLSRASVEETQWTAYQFDTGDGEAGVAYFFRRAESPFPIFETSLRALKSDWIYRVRFVDERRIAHEAHIAGGELSLRYEVHIPEPRSSLVLEYVRVREKKAGETL